MSGEKVQLDPLSSDGVVQSPDGSMQYYTSNPIKNKHNPYLYQNVLPDIEANDTSNCNYREVQFNGETILISESDLTRAIKLEWNATIVRFLCLLDFCINLFAAFSTYYIPMTSVIIAIISITGYHSTYTYSRFGLVSYLVYRYISAKLYIIFLGIYIAAAASSEFNEQLKNNSVIIINPTSGNIVIISLMTLGQIYITGFIQRFYNLLPHGRIRHRIRFTRFTN